jgi:hypothetical protein
MRLRVIASAVTSIRIVLLYSNPIRFIRDDLGLEHDVLLLDLFSWQSTHWTCKICDLRAAAEIKASDCPATPVISPLLHFHE